MTEATPARRHSTSAAMALVLAIAATAAAAPPDAATIVSSMKKALEPAQSSLRKSTLTVTQQGSTSKVTLGEARGKRGESNRILTVVLAPPDLRGMAYLVQEGPASSNNAVSVWLPAIGRVRTLVSPEAYSAFLNSDFTYADLGFTSLLSTYTIDAEDTVAGARVFRIQAVPPERWYYTRIVTTVAADTSLPIERKFYDPANELWKVERFEGVSTINGVPTAITTSMDDVQAKSNSTITVTDLQYGATIPDALLEPSGLPQAASSPIWASLNAPVKR
jgi:hypothetical protein